MALVPMATSLVAQILVCLLIALAATAVMAFMFGPLLYADWRIMKYVRELYRKADRAKSADETGASSSASDEKRY